MQPSDSLAKQARSGAEEMGISEGLRFGLRILMYIHSFDFSSSNPCSLRLRPTTIPNYRIMV